MVSMAVVAAVAAGVALPASAAPASTTLSALKARAASAISVRLSALHIAEASINTNKWLSAADKSTLLATMQSDENGLNALAPKIQADATVTQARADYRTIFTSYRVFALALPQARLAAASDGITGTVLPRLTDAKNRLAGLLAGKDAGKNTPAVQAAMADLASQIQAITTATTGLSAGVLGYTPAQYDANHAVLAGPRETLRTARTDIKAARGDIRLVVAAIK
jgi:hypothetical protein